MTYMMSIVEKKLRIYMACSCTTNLFIEFYYFMKKEQVQLKTKQLKQKNTLNQWESMGFHKLILDFRNSAVRLAKKIFGYSLKIQLFCNREFTM